MCGGRAGAHPRPAVHLRAGGEASGHYHRTLLGFLAERGHRVVLVNPWHATQFRRSQGKKAKTDRIDARTLARFVAVRGLEPALLRPAALEGLRELTRFHAELVVDRTASLNRLHAAVDLAFPELPSVLGILTRRTVIAVQTRPTAAALAAASPADVEQLVAAASHCQIGPARVDALLGAAGGDPSTAKSPSWRRPSPRSSPRSAIDPRTSPSAGRCR